MIVLHLFVPVGNKRIRQGPTWSMLELLRRHGRHKVVDWPTVEELDNQAALNFFWNRGETLCVLEQDVVPTLEQLVQLEACSEASVCNQATRCGGDPSAGYDFRCKRPDGTLRWGYESDRWCDVFPLGCTVFRPEAMARLESVPRVSWRELDTTLALRLGTGAHVHWPAAAHNH